MKYLYLVLAIVLVSCQKKAERHTPLSEDNTVAEKIQKDSVIGLASFFGQGTFRCRVK